MWLVDPDARTRIGAECYGWGGTLPMLIIRNIIGFRESETGFWLSTTLPSTLLVASREYAVKNLRWDGILLNIVIRVLDDLKLEVNVTMDGMETSGLTLTAEPKVKQDGRSLMWSCSNGEPTHLAWRR